MMGDIMFGDIVSFSVLEPVTASWVFGNELGKIVDFSVDNPIVFVEVPQG